MKISDWADALRSGNYAQGFDMLYDARSNEFDPVGVACDLINPRFKNRKPEMLDCIDFVVPVSGELAELMKAVLLWCLTFRCLTLWVFLSLRLLWRLRISMSIGVSLKLMLITVSTMVLTPLLSVLKQLRKVTNETINGRRQPYESTLC